MPRCPACKCQAEPIEYEGVRIYNCGQCGGNWLSGERMDVILGRRELSMPEDVRQAMMDLADRSNRSETLWCMTCGTPMDKAAFAFWKEIQYDHCPKCRGIWLDRGELEKCQIYWEYMQDHPEQWKEQDAYVYAALLKAQLDAQSASVVDAAATNVRNPREMARGLRFLRRLIWPF